MQSPDSLYLAMPVKLLSRTTTSVNLEWEILLQAMEQEKKGMHRQKARIHIQIRRVDLHFV